ncbi:tRNA dihydrouridine synthase DusB [Porticoccus sp. W117]|uniref:tRNA dihydrouridine synthase DusB n=1 Tax=Porticoccus sp. W117 TaxID=3054777 RepID=UPI002597337A|nr:tRNA dihydrouridine synthase DusB [Porticoccus sp. W117]MDM3872651.1 tRNA dihydrouridine synthase DusB [Porticoccus sp. W117]
MLQIGPYNIPNPTVLAPMAGVTDLPFRQLCRELGAGLVVAEMVTSDVSLWNSLKSQQRLIHRDEPEPRAVQIAGAEPAMMAEAAKANVELGAQIVDINMGCPAKKVCKRAAGSALLQDEPLVEEILRAVVAAVDVPVTLKIRTGTNPEQRNGATIARLAEQCGIAALAVHGRTRACRFMGNAEYDTIADIVDSVQIPVIANGDIDSPQKAHQVLDHTGAAAVMIGRSAQGQPWIFREINHFLATGRELSGPQPQEVKDILLRHINGLYSHYGDYMGLRIARKHVGWYLATNCHNTAQQNSLRATFNSLTEAPQQLEFLNQLFFQPLSQMEPMQEQVA